MSKDRGFKPISSCIEISKDVLKRSIAAGRTYFDQLYLKFNVNEWSGQKLFALMYIYICIYIYTCACDTRLIFSDIVIRRMVPEQVRFWSV